MKRDCVVRAREFADAARLAATGSPATFIEENVIGLYVFAHFAMPASWSAKKRSEMAGKLHRQKPDADNTCKLVADSLFAEDKAVPLMQCVKFWCDQDQPRCDVFLLIP